MCITIIPLIIVNFNIKYDIIEKRFGGVKMNYSKIFFFIKWLALIITFVALAYVIYQTLFTAFFLFFTNQQDALLIYQKHPTLFLSRLIQSLFEIQKFSSINFKSISYTILLICTSFNLIEGWLFFIFYGTLVLKYYNPCPLITSVFKNIGICLLLLFSAFITTGLLVFNYFVKLNFSLDFIRFSSGIVFFVAGIIMLFFTIWTIRKIIVIRVLKFRKVF